MTKMTKQEVVKRFRHRREVKFTMLVKLNGGFRYIGKPSEVTAKNITYHRMETIAEKNIFIRGCDMWGNTVDKPEIWKEPLVVLEKGDKFYMCTRK